MKKRFVSILLVAAMTASLAACGGSNGGDNSASATEKGGKTESASDGGEITLTIPTFFVGENVGAVYFEPAVERFNEANKGKYHIELEVLSSLTRAKGTIVKEATNVEKMLISGVAKDENVARISVIGVPDKPGLAFRIFSKLAQKNVNVDIILQSIGRNGTKDISFTVEKDKMDATIELMQSYVETIGASSVVFDDDVAKVSIVGAGMESHPGVASDMFEALFEANVNIQMISTSEIKISVLIKKEDANKAVAAIHAKFFEQIGQ